MEMIKASFEEIMFLSRLPKLERPFTIDQEILMATDNTKKKMVLTKETLEELRLPNERIREILLELVEEVMADV